MNKQLVSLRRFNNALSVVVIGLCLYVVLAPLWPQAQFAFQDKPSLVAAEEKGETAPVPEKNTLVIPRLKLQQEIHENAVAEWGLGQGVWRDPHTSNPNLGGNTVLSGHRFTYGGPAVFYHLDKVKSGDKIVVYWDKARHEYTVTEIREVPPTATEILKQSEDKKLTIYTCTPLITAKNRLVIVAEQTGDIQ